MPRIAGQVDETKTQAILDAALQVFSERGAAAPMADIARRAGVSKQTLYNRFPTRTDLARALARRRSDDIVAPLSGEGDVETILEAVATSLIAGICAPEKGSALRGLALISPDAPDIALAVYEAGPGASIQRLSAWLAEQHRRGYLEVPDPDHAAEMFTGMALGHGHLRSLLGVDHPRLDRIDTCAREAARRFVRAFAP
ncbi:TetR family transcriptional regulator [Rhizobium sp. CRIBSB]|nr:TetR family transcriptional regulator [Rhizobium sp. CRIBSB]